MTLDEVLEHGVGTERPFCCEVHPDSQASASVNVLKGVWCCYACGAAGTVGKDKKKAPSIEALVAVLRGATPPRTYPESWLDMFDASTPGRYWIQRLGLETAKYFRCGLSPMEGFPTYPLRDANGVCIGVVTRLPDGKPKYRYPYGVSTARTLFGLTHGAAWRKATVAVLVEGAPDVMALHAQRLPGMENVMVLGCYGAGLHAPQRQLLGRFPRLKVVVLGFDNDEAGARATEMARQTLSPLDRWAVVSVDWGTIGCKDPGEALALGRYAWPLIQQSLEER